MNEDNITLAIKKIYEMKSLMEEDIELLRLKNLYKFYNIYNAIRIYNNNIKIYNLNEEITQYIGPSIVKINKSDGLVGFSLSASLYYFTLCVIISIYFWLI